MDRHREVLNHNNQKHARRLPHYKAGVSKKKQLIRSICPKCNRYHTVYMTWTGHGLPRKFCSQCKATVAKYNDMIFPDPTTIFN